MRNGITVRIYILTKRRQMGPDVGEGQRNREYRRNTDGSGLCREYFQVRDLKSDPQGCVVLSAF